MGRFECRNDSFQFCQFVGGFYGFVVIYGQYCGTMLRCKVSMYRSDARIVQSGRDRIGLFNLPVFVLDDEGTCSVNDTHFPELDSCCGLSGFYAFSSGFCQNDAYPFVVQIMIDSTCSITSSTYTGDKIIGIVASLFFCELFFYLFTDH